MPSSSLIQWWRKISNLNRQRGQRKLIPQSRFRAQIESLEDRVVPTSFYTVSGLTDGNGLLSGGIGTSSNPYVYTTLRGAINAANQNAGSTITLPAGTYVLTVGSTSVIGELDVSASMTINGAGAGSTIIQQQIAGDRVFDVDPTAAGGVTFTAFNLAIEGGSDSSNSLAGPQQGNGGGAILDGGHLDDLVLSHCAFFGNSTSSNSGGAVAMEGGSLAVNECQFGGAGVGQGNSALVSGGAIEYFSNSQANNDGKADTFTITDSTFIDNSATVGGGVCLDIRAAGDLIANPNITDCNFIGNVATNTNASPVGGNGGGAIANFSQETLTVGFSRFIDNTAAVPANGNTMVGLQAATSSYITANENWWGDNNGPSANDIDSNSGTVTATDWLVLTNSANSATLNVGNESTLIADFIHDNTGVNVSSADPASNHTFPAFSGGTPGVAALIVNYNSPADGTVSAEEATIQSGGTATATYTGTTPGSGSSSVTVDGETATANIDVLAALSLSSLSMSQWTVSKSGFTGSIPISGGSGPYTISAQSGLPNGMTATVTGSNVTFVGTPGKAGDFNNVQITVEDANDNMVAGNYDININSIVSLAPGTLPADTDNIAYNQSLTSTGGTGTILLAVSNIQNAIPGLTVPSNGTGVLSITGTPTAIGTETFTVTATDSVGATASTNYSITVNPALSLAPGTLPADTINIAYNQTLTAIGGTGTLSLAVSNIQNAIPGLTVPSNGTELLSITGTPLATGTETFTVTATDSLGATAFTNCSITVNPTLSLNPGTLSEGTVNNAYNQPIIALGGTGTVSLAVSNIHNGIPGLTVPSSGTSFLSITGTPLASGTETFTVTATDSVGASTSTNYSIAVNPTLSLNPGTLPADTVNIAYNQPIYSSGGTGTVTLAVSNTQNAIPGLTVPSSGTNYLLITSTPLASGTETFTVTATDSLGATTSTKYSIAVNPTLSLNPGTLPADTVNIAYNQPIYSSGGTGTVTLAVSNIQNAIPGLSVPSGGTGYFFIAGSPLATGTETFTVTATDSVGATTSTDYSIAVNPIVSLSPGRLPADTIDIPFDQTLSSIGGTGTVTLAVGNIQNAIPGLTVPSSGMGVLSVTGTPAATGTETFTVTAIDSVGATTSTSYSITVNPTLSLNPGTLPADTINNGYNQPIIALGGTGTVSLDVSNIHSAIPGLTVPSGGTGFLSITGSPTLTGTETFTVTATDSVGATTSTNYSITVNPMVSLSPGKLPEDTVNIPYSQTITATGGTGNVSLTINNIQNLIPGLQIPASATGSLVISGTPTVPGTESFSVTATDSAGVTTYSVYSISVNAAPTLGTLGTTAWTVGRAYTSTIAISNGTSAFGTLTQSGLPNGLTASLNGSTITISGTPTVAGNYHNVQLGITDGVGAIVTETYNIAINAAPTIGNLTTTNWAQGSFGFTGTMTISNGTPLWMIDGNPTGLPTGMSLILVGNTLGFTGAPTKVGVYNGSVTVEDAAGAIVVKNFTIAIDSPLSFNLKTLPTYTINQAYSQTVIATGGTGKITLSVSPSTPLPAGLTLKYSKNGNSFTISGKPRSLTAITITVHAIDSIGDETIITYTLNGVQQVNRRGQN